MAGGVDRGREAVALTTSDERGLRPGRCGGRGGPRRGMPWQSGGLAWLGDRRWVRTPREVPGRGWRSDRRHAAARDWRHARWGGSVAARSYRDDGRGDG